MIRWNIFYSSENHLDFDDIPDYLLILEPAEEIVITQVHITINVFIVHDQQYKYKDHIIHFLWNIGKVYNQLPLLFQDLDIVILRFIDIVSNSEMDKQFHCRFRIRRFIIVQWLEFLIQNHPDYRTL